MGSPLRYSPPVERKAVEEHHAARIKVQGTKRRAVIRVEAEETHDYVRERRTYGDLSQEETDEIGFVPSALSEPRGTIHWCGKRCKKRASDTLRLHRWSRRNEVKLAQSICVNCVQRKASSAR